MTRQELIERITQAIAEKEGFYLTEAQARKRRIRYPSRAQRNANPGNVRTWRDARGKRYPTDGGYVDFVAWASARYPGLAGETLAQKAVEEGWRILRVLVGQYIDGRYTEGKPPSLIEMFRAYAPGADGNDPEVYARFVAGKLGVDAHQPLVALITA
ncbi:MAG: hypothetical protein KJZ70_10480 [Bryobacterales bacterium]|nr:hypothetical protein [Bryobacterales bacterium]